MQPDTSFAPWGWTDTITRTHTTIEPTTGEEIDEWERIDANTVRRRTRRAATWCDIEALIGPLLAPDDDALSYDEWNNRVDKVCALCRLYDRTPQQIDDAALRDRFAAILGRLSSDRRVAGHDG